MRALLLSALMSLASVPLVAQEGCSDAAKAAALDGLHQAQAVVLAIKQAPMDSGVPAGAVPALRTLKAKLASAADAVLACHPATDTPAAIGKDLQGALRAAAPGLPEAAASPAGDDEAPVPGTLGNDVQATVTLLSTKPDLLGVELSSSVPCGSDSQLLVYQALGGRWQRKLRWSSGLGTEKDLDFSSEIAGDFFLPAVLHVDGTPEGWRIVIAHGTPWCTSRFSSFGLAVMAPTANTNAGKMIWQTRRDASRGGDFGPRLKASGDTFEFRVNADAMLFDENGFERTVVYRYRISPAGLSRVQPIALNARGFVEEWLSMPAEEAQAQQQEPNNELLQQLHDLTQQTGREDQYTSWEAGPVRACTPGGDRVQVAFDSQHERIVVGKPGGEQDAPAHHYFQLRRVPDGYQLVSVSAQPDPACAGPDLMRKPAPATKSR